MKVTKKIVPITMAEGQTIEGRVIEVNPDCRYIFMLENASENTAVSFMESLRDAAKHMSMDGCFMVIESSGVKLYELKVTE